MAISFGGVVLTAFSVTKSEEDGKGESKQQRQTFIDNESLAAFIGCIMIIIHAFLNGAVAVQSRMLQHIDVFVTMFYVVVVGTFCQTAWILIEYWAFEHDCFRLFTMNSE